MELKIYRITGTGIFSYIGHDGTREIFRADGSMFSRHPEVSIHTGDGRFHFLSTYDPDTTLIPGVTTRPIRNRKNDSVCANLRFEDADFYSLFCPEGGYTIEERNGDYLCFADNIRLVMTMKRADPREKIPEALLEEWRWYDPQLLFSVRTQDIPEPTVALMCAFPLMRFDN